ncbi:unnamed protein product [Scytosiphon promiscuus]
MDGSVHRRQDATAAVPPASGTGIGGAPEAAAGWERASSGAQDVDYWNRPVAVAAAAAVAAASPKSSLGSSSSGRARARDGSFAASGEGIHTRNGSASRGDHPRVEKDGATGRLNFSADSFARARGKYEESLLSETSSFGAGLERVAEVGAAAASEEASRQQQRRRRVLQHVEVGRGGQEHFRDARKKRTEDAFSFGSGTGLGANEGDRWGLGGDDAVDDHGEGQPPSRQRRTGFDIPPGRESASRGEADLGGGESTAAPKKKVTKKRKNRPAPASAAALHSRRAGGHVHVHGGPCSRKCASSACPCGQASPHTMATKTWRLPRGSFGAR